jgi:RNA polymerase sigma-70 factor (ECF subfamily)
MFIFYLSMLDTEEQKNKFEDLYLTYRKLMFYIANKILKDDFLAEDAVHQTFIKIIEIIDKLEDVHGYKTKSYIVTMIKNQSINLYNKRKSAVTVPIEEMDHYLSDDINPQLEEQDALTKAVIKLPTIYKEVLTLKYVQEFSNSEIAGILNISEAAVRKRLERAKAKAQQKLTEDFSNNGI